MVHIGYVRTFSNVKADKAQALKPLEEAAEVFGSFQALCRADDGFSDMDEHTSEMMVDLQNELLDECADVIQATCNLIAALVVEDFTPFMVTCGARNDARGRF